MARRSADRTSPPPAAFRGNRRSDRLLAELSDAGRVVFVSHVQPDPDALGSMFGLSHLVERRLGVPTLLTCDGTINRAENRQMVDVLSLDLCPVDHVRWRADDAVVMVDSQPGTGRHTFCKSVPVAAVIDHHVTPGDLTAVRVTDVRPNLGATCTIVTQYHIEQHVAPTEKVATALMYGLETELTGFPRDAGPADDAALHYLYPFADKDLLAQIRNARLPQSHFACVLAALQTATVFDKVIVSWVKPLAQPEQAAEVAELLIRYDGADWALCGGTYHDHLLLSLRTTVPHARAGDVLTKVVGEFGRAGGHDRRAGGKIALAGRTPAQVADLERELTTRLLAAVGELEAMPRPLVEPAA